MPLHAMRTADECRAKALEMDILARDCVTAAGAAEYQKMAVHWRHLAKQAAWQANYGL